MTSFDAQRSFKYLQIKLTGFSEPSKTSSWVKAWKHWLIFTLSNNFYIKRKKENGENKNKFHTQISCINNENHKHYWESCTRIL